MARRLSDGTIKKIKELRRKGLSFNEIGKRLQLPGATTFYHARDESIEKKPITKSSDIDGKMLGNAWAVRVELPFTIICPGCGEELKEIGFLFDSSTFQDTLNCGAVINLRTAPRKEELSLK